jgi:tripartite-type tricarboxylate transporter receptor subunit TctC
MKLRRRTFLHLTATTVALPAVSRIARAQAYPTRPVHVIVGYPAGNASDIVARLIAQSLSERFGQQFIVENKPGAGSNIGTEFVVRSPPDGYTLLMEVVTANEINVTFYTNLNFNFIRDITPVASIGSGAYVIAINPSIPAKTLPEFIAYAKVNPGKINMASTGNGTPTHVFGELFMMLAGVKLLHVPYCGSFMADLLGGQVQNTPIEIIDRLNKEINEAVADSKMQAQLADMGIVAMPMTPADFGTHIADETEKWRKVILAANITAD